MPTFDRIVLVTRATPLEEVKARFATSEQARFVMERARVGAFAPLQQHEDAFIRSHVEIRLAVPDAMRVVELERTHLPNYVFGPNDLVATLGPDGLVVNVAKYLDGQPLIAFNPDPARMDGVLVPFTPPLAAALFRSEQFRYRELAMARVRLSDGQELHAVNDLFVGRRTHVSARYRLAFGGESEDQSSSGVIVSTGAGSTGWYRSIVTGAAAIAGTGADAVSPDAYRWDAEAPELRFSVREPFVSRTSGARLTHGVLRAGEALEIESAMAESGAIFSDGVEEDYLPFDSGATARIELADRRVRLVVGTNP